MNNESRAGLRAPRRPGACPTILMVLLAVGLVGCRREAPAQAASPTAAQPSVKVPLMTVTEREFPLAVAVTGTLVSRSRVDVKAETTGRILRFPKEEGDIVQAGEAVAWVDQENYRLQVKQAESAVAVGEASLERARVLEAHAASELERARNLVASGGITDKDLKSAQVAEMDSKAQTTLAKAQLDQMKAALDVARKHFTDATVRSPVAGEIQHKFINAGAYVEPPTAVFTVVDNSKLELESNVPSSMLGQVRAGQKVTFTVNSFPGVSFEGRVVDVSPAVDAESRAAKVRVQVSAGGKLKAGMFAEGEIVTGVQAKAIMVPLAAVYRDDRSAKDSFVYVSVNGKAARRAVKLGAERDSTVQVVEGLAPGDVLVAEQSIELGDGTAVEARR